MNPAPAQQVAFAGGHWRVLGNSGSAFIVRTGEIDLFVRDPESQARHLFAVVAVGQLLPDVGWPPERVLAVGHPGTACDEVPAANLSARPDSPALIRDWTHKIAGTAIDAIPDWDQLHSSAVSAFLDVLAQNRALAANRLEQRRTLQHEHFRAGTREIAAILSPRQEITALAAESDPLLSCLKIAARKLRIELPNEIAPPSDDPFARISQISRAANFRTRQITLGGSWWKDDCGVLIAFHREAPIVLIPRRPRGYDAVKADGSSRKVSRKVADGIAPSAISLYPGLPGRKLSLRDLLALSWPGNGRDLAAVGIISVIVGLLGIVGPWLSGQIFDFVIPLADRTQMTTIAAALIAAALGSATFEVARGINFLRIETRLSYTAQAAMWDRLLRLPTTFFRRFSSGDLASRANSISAVHNTFSQVSHTVLLGAPTALFNLIVMFRYDWKLSLLGIALALVVTIVIVVLNLGQLRLQRALLDVSGKLQSLTFQLISGIAKLRTAGAEESAFSVWARLFAKQRKLGFAAGRWGVAGSTILSGFPLLTSICIFIFVAWQTSELAKNGQPPTLTMGAFIAFNAAYGALLGALTSLASASLSMVVLRPQLERMRPLLDAEPESEAGRVQPGNLTGLVEMVKVHFRYTPEGPRVLQDVSLRIEPGTFVAVVGPSGSGKSTLLRLLLGFEQAETGTILYDNHDLQTLDPRGVREQIGTVLQSSRLMSGDVFRNIVGESTLTIEDAWRAAEAAGLADDIRAMPMGMFTVISDGGGGFSGGQRQRIMIARALARQPRLLYFDEATSALDNRNQAIVAESLESTRATRIVIAHRLSTIARADRIIVMHEGRIVEDGTFNSLMDANGLFHRLARRQLA